MRDAAEKSLGHAAIAEQDTFEARNAKPDKIEAAVEERHVGQLRLRQLCPGQAGVPKLDTAGDEAKCPLVRPVGVLDLGVNEVAEILDRVASSARSGG